MNYGSALQLEEGTPAQSEFLEPLLHEPLVLLLLILLRLLLPIFLLQ